VAQSLLSWPPLLALLVPELLSRCCCQHLPASLLGGQCLVLALRLQGHSQSQQQVLVHPAAWAPRGLLLLLLLVLLLWHQL
jgi:hypothetical protein